MNPATTRKKQTDQARHASKREQLPGKENTNPAVSAQESHLPQVEDSCCCSEESVLVSLRQTRSSLQAEVITLRQKKLSLTEAKMRQAEPRVFTEECGEAAEEADAESFMPCTSLPSASLPRARFPFLAPFTATLKASYATQCCPSRMPLLETAVLTQQGHTAKQTNAFSSSRSPSPTSPQH